MKTHNHIGIDKVSAMMGLGLVTTGVVLALTPTAALADSSEPSIELLEEQYTPAEISEQYRIDQNEGDHATSESSEFIEDTKNDGIYYQNDDIDVLEFASDLNQHLDLTVIVPEDYTVTEVDAQLAPALGDNGEDMVAVSAEMQGQIEASDALAYPDGPGFEEWSTVGSGSYTLNARVGKFYTTWFKQRVLNDGDSTYNYMSYKRKGSAEAYPRSFKPDARVHFSQAGSYPSSSETRDHHFVDWSPSTGTVKRSCDSKWNVSVSYGGISTGLNFSSCGKYTTRIKTGAPGDMMNRWEAGLTHTQTHVESGFAWVIALSRGATSITINDYQKVTFLDTVTDDYQSCTATNTSTCR